MKTLEEWIELASMVELRHMPADEMPRGDRTKTLHDTVEAAQAAAGYPDPADWDGGGSYLRLADRLKAPDRKWSDWHISPHIPYPAAGEPHQYRYAVRFYVGNWSYEERGTYASIEAAFAAAGYPEISAWCQRGDCLGKFILNDFTIKMFGDVAREKFDRNPVALYVVALSLSKVAVRIAHNIPDGRRVEIAAGSDPTADVTEVPDSTGIVGGRADEAVPA